jgi:hypothetical protein
VKRIRPAVLGFFIWALIAGGAWAAPSEVIEIVGNGEINWTKGIILAKGSGAPPKEARNIAQARLMTERAALTDARRNLLEVLKGVRVDSSTLVENFMAKSDQIRLQAEGFIQGSVEVRSLRRYLSDGAIEVTVAVDLAGDFVSLMMQAAAEAKRGMERPPAPVPESKPEKKILPPPPSVSPEVKPGPPPAPSPLTPPTAVLPEKKAEPSPPPAVPVPEKKAEPQPAPGTVVEKPLPNPAHLPPFTGLVLDTRGLGTKPALVIRILDEGGMELYRGQYVPPEKAALNGLALFSRDLTAAQTNPRVGKNPLTIKGAKVDRANPADIVLAPENARKLAPFAQKGTFLEDCRVMMVLD